MLRLPLHASRQLSGVLLLSHACAAACVLSVALPPWPRFMLLGALLLNLLHALANQAWRVLPFSVVAMEFEREGGARLLLRNGKMLEARVLGSSFVAPRLTIVLLKAKRAGFARAVVLLPDTLAPDLFRTLRVWLKWRLGRGAAPAAHADWMGSS